MSKFLNRAVLDSFHHSSTEKLYALKNDLKFQIGPEDSKCVITVPAGRVTNLASVPRTPLLSFLYREIVYLGGDFIEAAVLHDYLCDEQFDGIDQPLSGFTRFEADSMFRISLASMGCPWRQRVSAYLAVRLYAIISRLFRKRKNQNG